MPTARVVAHAPPEDVSAADQLIGEGLRIFEDLRFKAALNDSASELSALVPTAPIDWATPKRLHVAWNCDEVYTLP